jgi:hypothetical protein
MLSVPHLNHCLGLLAGVRTSMEALSDAGRVQPVYKAKMEIVLRKTDRFDEIMAQQAEEAAAEAEADVGADEDAEDGEDS